MKRGAFILALAAGACATDDAGPADDFHLQNQGVTVFADIATWQAGDPLVDIDEQPRPGIRGASDHAGADVP